MKKRRAPRRKGKFIFWTTILILALVAAFYILTAAFFDIREVLVKDSEYKSKIEKTIKGIFNQKIVFFNKKNIFLFSPEEAERKLGEKFLKLSDFSVDKNIIDREIIVNYEIRKPMGVYCREDSCSYIDNTGFVYEKAPRILGRERLTVNSNTEKQIGDQIENFAYFINLKHHLGAGLLNGASLGVKELSVKSARRWEVLTDKGWRLIFDPTIYEPSVLTALVSKTLDKADEGVKEYIDFRVKRRVYYK